MAKEKIVVLKNEGLSKIVFKGDSYMPGDDIEVTESELSLPSIESLIMRGKLSVKNDSEKTESIAAEAKSKRKKDPSEGKSRAELEDGGEF